MNLISAKEAAEKWNISQRRVISLCSEGRIKGAQLVGNSWVLPGNTKRPIDARTVEARNESNEAKPFLKWAGGKGQLLEEIGKHYPFANKKHIRKYAEPFVGGGAVLFDILNKHDVDEVYISDINAELINSYTTIRDNSDALITLLKQIEDEYLPLDSEARKNYYLAKRERFNQLKQDGVHNIEAAALMIFLNRTCFNGLYRVNRAGNFNVPMGKYAMIRIYASFQKSSRMRISYVATTKSLQTSSTIRRSFISIRHIAHSLELLISLRIQNICLGTISSSSLPISFKT